MANVQKRKRISRLYSKQTNNELEEMIKNVLEICLFLCWFVRDNTHLSTFLLVPKIRVINQIFPVVPWKVNN
uniref:Uncharacterized protein n=1 Tax=Anguilla anguilla TaxID=7936 RepID=A0A0E9SWU4_ANGAN